MRIALLLVFLFPVFHAASGQSGPDIIWLTNGPGAHFASVTSIAFSSDSARVASGSEDRHAKVWSVSQGDLVRDITMVSPQEGVLSVALSSDGMLLGTGGDEGMVRMWRVSDGFRLWQNSPNDNFIVTLAFSPNDQVFADAYRGNDVVIHNPADGMGIRFSGHEDIVRNIAFSPDNSLLASGSDDQTARLWLVTNGSTMQIFIGHSNEIDSVDFSPDGKLLATASADGTARIWNVTNGVCLAVMDGGGGVAKFSTDGKYLFSLSDGRFKVWRMTCSAYVGSITNTGALCFDIAKNGKYFAYGRGDGAVVLARMPLVVDELSRTGNETVLKWQGGSGLYQLQSRTNLMSGSWENVGGTTTNITVTNISSTTLFFRVQSLPFP